MKKKLLLAWMLTKRLYKKPAFLALLLLIPLLVVAFGGIAGEESGLVTVALYIPEDAAAVRPLLESELLVFLDCDSPEEAENKVRYGKADAAWIFPENLEKRLEIFCLAPGKTDAIVRVVQREDSTLLRMAYEKLSGSLITLAGPVLYEQFARENGLEHLSREALLQFYAAASPDEPLFRFEDSGSAVTVTYLTAPVRGLLAVVCVLAALAAAMFFNEDLQKGTFAAIPFSRLPLLEICCQMICLIQVGLICLIALVASGLAELRWAEVVTMALYLPCCAGFAMVLRSIFPRNEWLGAILTVLTVVMIGLCPIFFDMKIVPFLPFLLPPTYYIRGSYDSMFWLYAAAYTLGCGVCMLPRFLRKR